MQDSPLEGFTVGITADRRWEEQAELLRRRGARVLHGPSIKTLPLGPEQGLQVATQRLIDAPPRFVIANTGIGMRSWFAAADSWGMFDDLFDALGSSAIYARGPKASGAVHQLGLEVKGTAASERLGELVETLLTEPIAGEVIAFQRHGAEADEVLEPLRAAGADVFDVPVYQWRLPDDHGPALRLIEAAIDRRVDAVTFTSAPALRNLMAIADDNDLLVPLLGSLNDGVIAMCVGPVCSQAATEEGITAPVVPERWRLGPMIRALASSLEASIRCYRIGASTVELRGNVIAIDGDCVTLPARERALLVRLLAGAGTVVAKSELVRVGWGDDATDGHLVEVTIARLRTRLGPIGAAIRSVPRRGYLLEAVPTM